MNFMLVAILIVTIFIVALSARITANPHKNIILENTIQQEHLNEPEITKLRKEYKLRLLQIAGVISLLSLLLLLCPYDSLLMLGFLVIVIGSIASQFYCQVYYIRKMRLLIVKNHWTVEVSPMVIDTKLVAEKNKKMLSMWWLLPALLLTIAGCIYTLVVLGSTTIAWLFIAISVILTVLFVAMYYSLSRLPVKSYTADTAINKQYNNLFRHHWSVILVALFWVFVPISILPVLSLQMDYQLMQYLMIGFMAFVFLDVLFSIYYLYDLRKKQDKLIEQAPAYRYTGDDAYWKFGIYINPNDSRLMVADRVGMNMSINLGKKSAKVIMSLTGILLSCLFFITLVPMFLADFGHSPFQATISKEQVTLQAPFSETSLSLNDIEEVSLIKQLPNDRVRVFGTGTENYQLGEFKVDDKAATLYVDTSSSPILKIQTKKKDYYFTSKDSKNTESTYTKLKDRLTE
ncbi:hypothetical protein BAU15_10100 [Enterococcus sp. JM4C]|uniref:PH domain-containing protein n=1 Tax=Candidatus Enterococcus huntleyi TaxID=1857217 RepID=UPI00137ACA63|nr:PH domain-containing protein [Enterococcus sp. JM4C]KAF1296132.1 hypothetical protein BAU15_10100 [Enterococcus sp. JM4C]